MYVTLSASDWSLLSSELLEDSRLAKLAREQSEEAEGWNEAITLQVEPGQEEEDFRRAYLEEFGEEWEAN